MTTKNTYALWPALIIAIVTAFAAFTWWSIDRATSKVSAISDPDYYAHGLKYHSAALDTKIASTTGWTVTPSLTGRTLTIAVHDSRNNSIVGGQATINFPPEKQSGRKPIAPLTLTEIGEGSYSGTLPSGLPLSVSVTLTLTKDQAMTQRQILINQDS